LLSTLSRYFFRKLTITYRPISCKCPIGPPDALHAPRCYKFVVKAPKSSQPRLRSRLVRWDRSERRETVRHAIPAAFSNDGNRRAHNPPEDSSPCRGTQD